MVLNRLRSEYSDTANDGFDVSVKRQKRVATGISLVKKSMFEGVRVCDVIETSPLPSIEYMCLETHITPITVDPIVCFFDKKCTEKAVFFFKNAIPGFTLFKSPRVEPIKDSSLMEFTISSMFENAQVFFVSEVLLPRFKTMDIACFDSSIVAEPVQPNIWYSQNKCMEKFVSSTRIDTNTDFIKFKSPRVDELIDRPSSPRTMFPVLYSFNFEEESEQQLDQLPPLLETFESPFSTSIGSPFMIDREDLVPLFVCSLATESFDSSELPQETCENTDYDTYKEYEVDIEAGLLIFDSESSSKRKTTDYKLDASKRMRPVGYGKNKRTEPIPFIGDIYNMLDVNEYVPDIFSDEYISIAHSTRLPKSNSNKSRSCFFCAAKGIECDSSPGFGKCTNCRNHHKTVVCQFANKHTVPKIEQSHFDGPCRYRMYIGEQPNTNTLIYDAILKCTRVRSKKITNSCYFCIYSNLPCDSFPGNGMCTCCKNESLRRNVQIMCMFVENNAI